MATGPRQRRRDATDDTTPPPSATIDGIPEDWQQRIRPIDEDEQRKILAQVRAESSEMVKRMATAVTVVCYFAAGAMVLVSFVFKAQGRDRDHQSNSLNGVLLVSYPVCSALAHLHAARMSARAKLQVPKYREGRGSDNDEANVPPSKRPLRTVRETGKYLITGAAAIALQLLVQIALHIRVRGDAVTDFDDTMRLAQLVGNFLTMVVSMFVFHDAICTEESLREVENSKYRFKTL